MKNTNASTLSYCYMLVMFLLASCHKTNHSYVGPPAQNLINLYDKGIGFEEDFDHVVQDWNYYLTDTVSTLQVTFTALDSPVTSYKWSIGAGEYNTKNVSLRFPSNFLTNNGSVDASLAIRYTTPSGKDTSRTFRKTLYFLTPCRLAFNGTFKGYLDTPSNLAAFFINTCAHDSLYIDYGLYISNLTTGCSRYFSEGPDSYDMGYRQIVFSGAGSTSCNSPRGSLTFRQDTLHLDYASYDNGFSKPSLQHHFKGVKQ